MVGVKRVYEPPGSNDGFRVLVDRLWPRGVGKEEGRIDAWLKEIAPSDELRKWFGHDPDRWNEFLRRYFAELEQKEERVAELAEKARQVRVTLVFGAKDVERNNAVALREYLAKRQRG